MDGESYLNNMTDICFKIGVTQYELEHFGLPNALFYNSETADGYVSRGSTFSGRSLTWNIDERNGTSVYFKSAMVFCA